MSNIRNLSGKAFTVIELVIVVGAATILVAIAAGVYISFLKKSYVDINAREMQSVLNLARIQTLSSEEEQSFGVHIDDINNEYVLFEGNTYNSSNPNNKSFNLHTKVSIGSINIRGGGRDIVFERLTGETSNFGVITLVDTSNSALQLEICVHPSGIAEVQEECTLNLLSYEGGTTNADLAFFPSNSGWGDPAQSFTVGSNDIYANSVELYLRKTTVNPSDVFLEIRETSTIGNVIGRSWLVDGSSVSTTYAWTTFDFSNPVLLQAGTQYFLRLRSFPDSAVPFSGGVGTIYWGYEHSASAPPAYAGGDAWRYVNQGNVPTDDGEQLGPLVQYDFSFRINYGINPPTNTDSRHLEFDLENPFGYGWSIQGATTLTLVFSDSPNPDITKNVTMANFFSGGATGFGWEDEVDVNGDTEELRVHTHYIDSNDTVLSIHRDQILNNKAVAISIDGKAIVSYTAGGTPTVEAYGGNMVYR